MDDNLKKEYLFMLELEKHKLSNKIQIKKKYEKIYDFLLDTPDNKLIYLLDHGLLNLYNMEDILLGLLRDDKYDVFNYAISILNKDIDYNYKRILNYFALTGYWRTGVLKDKESFKNFLSVAKPDIRFNQYQPIRMAIYCRNNLVAISFIKYAYDNYNKEEVKVIFNNLIKFCDIDSDSISFGEIKKYLESLLKTI